MNQMGQKAIPLVMGSVIRTENVVMDESFLAG